MAISLYDATVLNFIQTVGAVSGILDRGLAHFKETGVNAEDIVEARLAPDMLALRFQIVSVAHQSLGAIQGATAGHSVGERKLPFVAENFLLSFSLPNFYFHATTAYDILRSKGVPLGKRDFLGRPRIKV